jgi:hypothetical protein
MIFLFNKMAEKFCKITSSGRCAKTKNANENDPNCMYNESTKRCNKIKKKAPAQQKKAAEKKAQVQQKKAVEKKPPVQQKKAVQKKMVPIVQNRIPFYLNNDTKSIEFTGIPQKFFLKNVLNSTEDLNAIMEHLKLPKMKSKMQKFLSIREYISKILQKFPIKKISFDTIELDIPFHAKVVYQYNNYNSLRLYDLTILLLYFNINETASLVKKKTLCEEINKFVPINRKEIQKDLFQKFGTIKNCNSLDVKKINDILSSLNIYKTKATKKEKCSIIANIDKLDSTKPYVVLDNEHVLFNTKPKKILYNIYRNILDNKFDLHDIFHHLQKCGIIPYETYKIPTVGNSINKLIKNAILTKENFPNHVFVKQLQTIPKTPSIPPTVPQQHLLSHKAFLEFSKKMNHHVTTYGKKFVSGTKRLIDLVPSENILKNGKDIRMYHGTKALHWNDIKKNGIKPIGDGTLGKGFYFTPNVEKATVYLLRQKHTQKRDVDPVLIELVIKDADKLIVGSLESKCPIKTKMLAGYGDYWQFIVRSEDVIKEHFRIDRVFRLDM